MVKIEGGWNYRYPVIQKLGDLSAPTAKGTQKRVCICEFNGELRLDIRRWSNEDTMFKGISLTEDEVRRLRQILDRIDFGNLE